MQAAYQRPARSKNERKSFFLAAGDGIPSRGFGKAHVPGGAAAGGLKCGCGAPLIAHGRVPGTIQLGRWREVGYTSVTLALIAPTPSMLACPGGEG